MTAEHRLELYWIPLGAGTSVGARVVRTSGRLYEAFWALAQRRDRQPVFHTALIAHDPQGSTVVEVAPVPDGDGDADRGTVGQGPVGLRSLGRFRLFRYEVRRWRDGTVPDLPFAVASPVTLTNDPLVVARTLDLVDLVPTPVWGRDELRAGEMWNSNSVVSWMLARAGLLDGAGEIPDRGRAPGWDAGIRVASRSTGRT